MCEMWGQGLKLSDVATVECKQEILQPLALSSDKRLQDGMHQLELSDTKNVSVHFL